MTPTQYKKSIEQELRKLNKSIDYKIVHGERYADESRRHKELLRQMRTQKTPGLFSRFLFQV